VLRLVPLELGLLSREAEEGTEQGMGYPRRWYESMLDDLPPAFQASVLVGSLGHLERGSTYD